MLVCHQCGQKCFELFRLPVIDKGNVTGYLQICRTCKLRTEMQHRAEMMDLFRYAANNPGRIEDMKAMHEQMEEA